MMCRASRFKTVCYVWKYVLIKNAPTTNRRLLFVPFYLSASNKNNKKKNPIILRDPCVCLETHIIFLLFDRFQIIQKPLELSSAFITIQKRTKKLRFQKTSLPFFKAIYRKINK